MWIILMFLLLVAAIVVTSYLTWMRSGGIATYIEKKSREFDLGYKFPWA